MSEDIVNMWGYLVLTFDPRLAFLREEESRQGRSTLAVQSFLKDAPVCAGINTISGAQTALQEALEHLAHVKSLKISKARADRWDVEKWTVQLLR
jgi:hypothetical protein